jgi:MoxR-like ATPase
VESSDLFVALFEESRGPSSVPVSIIRQHGVEPDALVSRIATRMRDHELREEQFRKRFELPPFLRNFATNLNLLARQDRIPPVFGRDVEIQQVLEILSHRERSNSVMLVGEPGVGKTAIVEGLARRLEFEPDTIPSRLRDCQIVNLQMNSLVAGTMLRGMFEDRLHNVIREVKERPNLVLFVDEAHTMVGAGSAIGAPADAANIFKSVLSRGEVRIIGATTRGEYKEYIQEDEALARRFRTVNVPEPTLDETRRILVEPAAAARTALLGADARRGRRGRARTVTALRTPPAAARQGDRLARHRVGAHRDRQALGSDRGRRGGGRGAHDRRFPRTWCSATSAIASRASRRASASASSARRRRSRPWRGGWCSTRARSRTASTGPMVCCCSSVPPVSARPSWPRPSPSSCSATRRR